MIDYDKLKLAYELASKCGSKLSFGYSNENNQFMGYTNIDNLITELQQLTQPDKPKPKYEIGQEVFWLEGGKDIFTFKVGVPFFNDVNEWEYDNVPEKDLYPSRQSLIEAQIAYWESLRECQHENNGMIYELLPEYKCIKCGEFYT